MDLKIDEVAQLLSVSEHTISQWLVEGKIPSYKISDEHRFSRIEIENWMLNLKSTSSDSLRFSEKQIYPKESESVSSQPSKGGMQQYGLYRAIHKGDVLVNLDADTKEEVIRSTLSHVAPHLGFDAELASEMFLDRERLMPTSLNHGVAVPHSREFVLNSPGSDAVIVVFPNKPIAYGALDGEDVHTLFFILSSDDKRHLQLLAKIAHLTGSAMWLDKLKEKPSKEAFLQMIMDWESSLRA